MNGRGRLGSGGLCALALAVVLIAPVSNAEPLVVSYVGLNNTHLQYDYTATAADLVEVKLTATPWGGEPVTLVSAPGPTLQGTFHHEENLQPNTTYTYAIRIVTRAPGQDPVEQTVASASAVLNGTITGTLLFDDTVNGAADGFDPVYCNTITVPAGRNLYIEHTNLSGGSIKVEGQISLSSDSTFPTTLFSIYSPHTFSALKHAKMSFRTGSNGSVISGGEDLRIRPVETSLQVLGIKDLTLDLSNLQGLIEVGALGLTPTNLLTENLAGTLNYAAAGHVKLSKVDVGYAKGLTDDYSIFLQMAGSFTADGCTFRPLLDLGVYGKVPNNIEFKNCKFFGNIAVIGGAPKFENCTFAHGLTLHNRTGASFRGNTFAEAMMFTNDSYNHDATNAPYWYEKADPKPTIVDNSFVGEYALRYSDLYTLGLPPLPEPIAIGSNYYGAASGPTRQVIYPSPSTWDFMANQGGIVTESDSTGQRIFELAGFNTTGNQFSESLSYPSFWLAGWIVGQNTISFKDHGQTSGLVRGKETLLSISLFTNYLSVLDARVYAVFDGKAVEAVASGKGIHRDPYWFDNQSIAQGRNTVNFILPPTDKPSATVEVWLDTTKLTGYDADDDGKDDPGYTYRILPPQRLSFASPYGRQLNVVVQPIQLCIGPSEIVFGGVYTPNGDGFMRHLDDLFPAMLPIRKEDIYLVVAKPYSYWSMVADPSVFCFQLVVEMAAGRRLIDTCSRISGRPDMNVDFVVGVLEHGSMGDGTDGASYPTFPSVCLVDEQAPDATLHEILHGFGLWSGPGNEQYERYPINGLPLLGATAFVNTPTRMLAPFRNCEAYRIHHCPAQGGIGYVAADRWFDIMGNSYEGKPVNWPILETLTAYATQLRGRLGTKTSSLQAQPRAATPLPTATRRIYVQGNMDLDATASIYRFRPGTVLSFDLTSIADGTLPPAETGAGDAYTFKAFSATGGEIFSKSFIIPKPADTDPVKTWVWNATFDVPDTAARATLKRTADGTTVLDVAASSSLSVQLLSPAAGTTLGDTVTIQWQTSGSTSALHQLMLLSTDGGTTWDLIPPIISQNKADLSTSSLPMSNAVSIRVLVSDGLRTAEARVDNLRITNRPPVVQIAVPHEGDKLATGTPLTLQAKAYDAEDGLLSAVAWNSSIDGNLGTDDTLSDVVLSDGDHTITCTATDSAGATGTAQVHVSVGAMPTVDLFLTQRSLRLFAPGRGSSNPAPLVLKVGASNGLMLSFRNTGVGTNATLSLYVLPPGGAETLLASQALTLAPFAEGVVEAVYTPPAAGDYRFRGVISDTTPPDSDPTNNERTWTYSTVAKEPGIAVAPTTKDFGGVKLANSATQTFTVSNDGTADLVVGQIELSGADAAMFKLQNDHASGATILPGASRTFDIVFAPTTAGAKTAVVLVPSSDPEALLLQIALNGAGIDESKLLVSLALAPANAAGATVQVTLSNKKTLKGKLGPDGTAQWPITPGVKATSLKITKKFSKTEAAQVKTAGLSGTVKFNGTALSGASAKAAPKPKKPVLTAANGTFSFPAATIGAPRTLTITKKNP